MEAVERPRRQRHLSAYPPSANPHVARTKMRLQRIDLTVRPPTLNTHPHTLRLKYLAAELTHTRKHGLLVIAERNRAKQPHLMHAEE
eukprot:scaffold38505_cov35-Tisochrysis_lutea.AAC.1